MPRAPFHLDTIKKVLAQEGEMRQADLMRAMGMSAGTIWSAVKSAIRSGEVLRREEKRGTRTSVYFRLAPGLQERMNSQREAAIGNFRFRVYEDGDVDFHGLQELQDGGRRMTAAMFNKMLAEVSE